MKKIITLSLLFISTIILAQETKKNTKETITVKKEKKANLYTTCYKNFSGTTTMTKKEIEEMDVLTVCSSDSINPFVITSFEITTVAKGNIKTVICVGNKLSSHAKGMLPFAEVGKKIFIDNVKAENLKTKQIKSLPGMTIIVKQ